MRKRILFQAPAGGLGHLSRLTAIAEQLLSLDPDVQPVILSDGTVPPWNSEVPYLPLVARRNLLSRQWLRWGPGPAWSVFENILVGTMEGFRPHVVVYDTIVWQALRQIVLRHPVHQVLVLRRRKDFDTYFARYARRLSTFQLILVVGEVAEPEAELPSRLPTMVRRIAPIVRHDRASLQPAAARQRYGVSPDETLIVITVGGGGTPEARRFIEAALQGVAACCELLGAHRVIVVSGPLADFGAEPEKLLEPGWGLRATFVANEPRMAELLAAATAVICQGGYNTLAEVVDVGTPAVCVPAPRAFDDQKSRAVALQRAGYDVLVARMSSRSISSRLRMLLRRHGVTFTPGPTRFSGAAEAADALLDLLKGSPDTPWHQHLSGGACDDLWSQSQFLARLQACW
jgi:predicted glycosyltransferase